MVDVRLPLIHRTRVGLTAALVCCAGIPVLASAESAVAAPTVPAGFSVAAFAGPPATAPATTLPDDIVRLDDTTYVGYSNNVPKTGPGATGPQNSLLVAYNDNGSVSGTYTLRGRIDGLGADPANHRVIVTVNEDGNSALYTVTPGAPAASQVVAYTYAPNPSATSGDTTTPNTVNTGGGTDSVSVVGGQIFTTASSPSGPNNTMVFRVVLSAPAGGTGTATLNATFPDNATARQVGVNTGMPDATLGVTDPDSTATVPLFAPLFGGQTVIDAQADQQLIFVDGLDLGGPFGRGNLSQLQLFRSGPPPGASTGFPASTTNAAGVDDVRWTEGNGGTLYVVDNGTNTIYAVTGPFTANQAFAALDTFGNATDSGGNHPAKTDEVDALDVSTGSLKPFVTGLSKAKGLLWVPSSSSAGGGGASGTNGTNGTNGTAGAPGPVGARGDTGPQGPAGAVGPRGPAGRDGLNGHGGASAKHKKTKVKGKGKGKTKVKPKTKGHHVTKVRHVVRRQHG